MKTLVMVNDGEHKIVFGRPKLKVWLYLRGYGQANHADSQELRFLSEGGEGGFAQYR